MVGMLDVLEKDNLNDKQPRQLLIAKRSANDLLQLMNDILDISQIESNELMLVEQSVNLPKANDVKAQQDNPSQTGDYGLVA